MTYLFPQRNRSLFGLTDEQISAQLGEEDFRLQLKFKDKSLKLLYHKP